MDALVRAFASEDDAVVVAADEGDVVDDGDAGIGECGGDASDDDSDASGASETTWRMRRTTYLADPLFVYCFALYAKTRAWPLKHCESILGGGAPHVNKS